MAVPLDARITSPRIAPERLTPCLGDEVRASQSSGHLRESRWTGSFAYMTSPPVKQTASFLSLGESFSGSLSLVRTAPPVLFF
jgi:hypothetical protein